MPKFQKRNTRGFQLDNVPYNKGLQSGREKNLPAPYKRLSPEMHQIVSDPPSASERQEMVLRPGCHHFLRPRTLKSQDETKCWNAKISNRYVNFLSNLINLMIMDEI